MNRTLFYDLDTGQLLHAHYEVRAMESDDTNDVRLSEPAAVEPDRAVTELVMRGVDLSRLGSVTTRSAPQSSHRTARFVDVRTGRLRSRRLEADDDLSSSKGE